MGASTRPRGHALAYFDTTDGRIFATYLVLPPIVIDLARYLPPMFAGHIPTMPAQEASAMPLPPVAEEIPGGVDALERLARQRDDDLVYCGRVDPTQLERLLLGAAEAGARYAALYRDSAGRDVDSTLAEAQAPALDVGDVMLSLMGDHEKVSELSKLIGKLRYALDGRDTAAIDEAIRDMEGVGRHLSDKYRVGELISAARRPGALGARLAELHVQRCYKLVVEEYEDVAKIEEQIRRALQEEG